jgi:peroxiredoxin
MTIKVGDRLPEGTVQEFIEVEGNGCTVGPNTFKVQDQVKGKKIAIFGLPGAFTPTCSAKHVPSYLNNIDKLKAKGVDEVWCFAANDPFVMGAWARDQKANGKIRFMGDGSAEYTKKLGVVKTLNVEAPGKFEVSGAETMLGQL